MKFTEFPTMLMGTDDGEVHTPSSHSMQAILPSILPATFANTNDKIVEIISLIFNNKPRGIAFYFYEIKLSFLKEQLFL